MATAITTDVYLQQIHTARTQLHEYFRRAHELLVGREAQLVSELETIQNNYETETTSQQEELQGLEASKQALKKNLRNNDTLNTALAAINKQMEQILKLSSVPARTIRFEWNTGLDRDIEHAGEIIITALSQPANLSPVIPQLANLIYVTPQLANLSPAIPPPIPDYKNKSMAVITCCKHKKGTAPGEFYYPNGLAIEPQSGRIYIADTDNNRVQVFTPNGEYSFMFSSKMNGPWGICINNDSVYISEWEGDCITAYKLNGTFVKKVGSSVFDQFNSPRGLAISTGTGLYVCDCRNHRVQLFSKELIFHSMFADNIVYFPNDVKLTQHLVIVLDEGDPCLHLFNIDNQSLLRSIIVNKQASASFFTIDRELNILLTDYIKHCVCVFSQSGELITQFGKEGHSAGNFYVPTGIAIDNQNRIVVVSENKNNALQLF